MATKEGNERRRMLLRGVAAAAGVALAPKALFAQTKGRGMKIGIIGSGNIGGSLGVLWAQAGYDVFFSSRHPDQLGDLVRRAGPSARAGTPREAAAFGEVVLISVPYGAVPELGRDLAPELAGKVVLETGNPYPSRDGAMAEPALEKGTGLSSQEFLPGVRLVRAFNSVPAGALASGANRSGERIAIPLAGDDADALELASRLVRDAGFEPVVVGSLASAKEFDRGTSVYGQALTARELRQRLGMDPATRP
ncbi:MAG TPA: NAD(P)-binding domain-containing protein [Burkholderiales bacterium]|nr:NAD(P)-binding domain-containing protein [Burkholderiales bacterium]